MKPRAITEQKRMLNFSRNGLWFRAVNGADRDGLAVDIPDAKSALRGPFSGPDREKSNWGA